MLNRLFPQCLRQAGREPELNRVVVLRGLVAFIFLGAGIMKLVGAAESMAHFDDLGLPGWMALVIGVAEVACAVLLFVPTGFVAAILGMLAIMGQWPPVKPMPRPPSGRSTAHIIVCLVPRSFSAN